MKILDPLDVNLNPVDLPGAQKVKSGRLLSEKDGVPNFAMRMFLLEPGGNTPLHTHPFEHEIYALKGEGLLYMDGTNYNFKEGYAMYVPPDIEHQFIQQGTEELMFLCMVPLYGDA